MSISLEQIDEMRKRTNCSYEEAKELLEKHNGDVVDAIVEFEKKHRQGFGHKHHHNNQYSFRDKIRELVHKGFKTRFIIEKDKDTILSISINVLIIIFLFTMPAFWFYPIALVLTYLLGFKIKIRKEKGEDIDINKMVNNVESKVKNSVDNTNEKVNNKENNANDDYNEITVE